MLRSRAGADRSSQHREGPPASAMQAEPDIYPPIEPFAFHRIRVDDIHTLYVEECGNRQGIPAVFLHGGPGAGCEPTHRRFFDPKSYRIVLFDQRGSGRSAPHAELRDNSTWMSPGRLVESSSTWLCPLRLRSKSMA